jgi:predicted flap endonuclease-1-like 5' DNA nuclease
MASVIHIAEVAAILTVAYALGWVIGYVAHRLAAGKPAVPAVIAEAAVAAPAPSADALVRAPVIDPVPSSPPPSVPAAPSVASTPAVEPMAEVRAVAASAVELQPVVEPVPEPVAAIIAQPEPEAIVEPEAAHALAPFAMPEIAAPPPMRVERVPPIVLAPLEPEPEPETGPVVLTASPSMKPGEAWSGEIRGRAPAPLVRTVEERIAAVEAVAEPFHEPLTEVPFSIDLGPLGPDSTHGDPILPQLVAEDLPADPVGVVQPDIPPATEPEPPPSQPVDEGAAMRAIEGGWSRVRARAMSNAPEISDVGAAVAAAQSAVEQVLAEAGIDETSSGQAARPKGLPRPRNGSKDDLKRIDGLGVLDESTLNNLGVFHFDQIAGWNAAQVLWMENHVFARGRIGHENWQQQARDLAATVAT